MSELLENYFKELDAPKTGVSLQNNLASLSKEYAKKAEAVGASDNYNIICLENEVHQIVKSMSQGIQPVMKGTKEIDGKTVEVLIPDFTIYGKTEYDHIEKRYAQTTSLYLKTEYGLMLYLNGRLQKNEDRKELCRYLVDLASSYKLIVFAGGDNWPLHSMTFYTRLNDALTILYRGGEALRQDFNALIKLIEDWFLSLAVDHHAFISYSRFIAGTFSEYKRLVKNFIRVNDTLTKFDDGIVFYIQNNLHFASLIAEKTLIYIHAFDPTKEKSYHEKLGDVYERLGDSQIKNNIGGALSHYSKAMPHFKESGNDSSLNRVGKKYDDNKGKFPMGTVSVETSEEEVEELTNYVAGVINRASKNEIFTIMCGYGLFYSEEKLDEMAAKLAKHNTMVNLVGNFITDKYGNTLKSFGPDEKLEYHRMNCMEMNYGFSVSLMFKIIQRSLYEKIFSYQDIKSHLETSWMNQPIEWFSGGKTVTTIPLNSLLPGIKSFFDELERVIENMDNNSYKPDFILSTDSLAPKIEMILRYMCRRCGIPTTKPKFKGGQMLTEEKILGELTDDLKEILHPDDRLLIKRLINEKAGPNIRNEVTHGLVNAEDYNPIFPMTLIAIILRLSRYQLTTVE